MSKPEMSDDEADREIRAAEALSEMILEVLRSGTAYPATAIHALAITAARVCIQQNKGQNYSGQVAAIMEAILLELTNPKWQKPMVN